MTRYLSGSAERIIGPYEMLAAGRARAWNAVKVVAMRIRNRRAVTSLLDWDERALRDIGLTRSDVHLSLALPLSEDPSSRLVTWAAERRHARLQYGSAVSESADRAAPQLRLVSGAKRSSTASISR